MRRATSYHALACKFLAALWAFQVPVRVVFYDAFYQAFDQATAPSFMIFVEEGFAFCTMDGYGATVGFFFFCHGSQDSRRMLSRGTSGR